MFAVNVAHPTNIKRKPKYIGLRVWRWIPDLTSDEDDSGFIGLTVVFARLNSRMPSAHAMTPDNPIIQPTID